MVARWTMLLISFAFGCSSVSDPRTNLDGNYLIGAVNGQPLPALFFEEPGRLTLTILSGELSIAGGRYEARSMTRREANGQSTVLETIDRGRVVFVQLAGLSLVSEEHPGGDGSITVVDSQTFILKGDLGGHPITYVRK